MKGVVDSQELLVGDVSKRKRLGGGEDGPPSDENGSIASVVVCGGSCGGGGCCAGLRTAVNSRKGREDRRRASLTRSVGEKNKYMILPNFFCGLSGQKNFTYRRACDSVSIPFLIFFFLPCICRSPGVRAFPPFN